MVLALKAVLWDPMPEDKSEYDPWERRAAVVHADPVVDHLAQVVAVVDMLVLVHLANVV